MAGMSVSIEVEVAVATAMRSLRRAELVLKHGCDTSEKASKERNWPMAAGIALGAAGSAILEVRDAIRQLEKVANEKAPTWVDPLVGA